METLGGRGPRAVEARAEHHEGIAVDALEADVEAARMEPARESREAGPEERLESGTERAESGEGDITQNDIPSKSP